MTFSQMLADAILVLEYHAADADVIGDAAPTVLTRTVGHVESQAVREKPGQRARSFDSVCLCVQRTRARGLAAIVAGAVNLAARGPVVADADNVVLRVNEHCAHTEAATRRA